MTTSLTTRLTPTIALDLWREALTQEVGIRIPCNPNDIDRIRAAMYSARKDAPDSEALGVLMLCIAPGGEEFWLVKKAQEAP